MTSSKTSILDAQHRALGARMTEFGGWDMPLNYSSGTLAEHLQCRRDSVVFDVSHLGSVLLDSADAFERLQSSFTNDLSKIAPGRAQYTHLLDEGGSVLDDIIVWWLEDSRFLVIPNASNTDSVRSVVGGRDVTDERVLLAVQGPRSRERIVAALGEECWVPRFRVRSVLIGSAPCLIAGTGYTGEPGVEIHVPASAAAAVWQRLVDAEASPAGLGARDTLRLEAGLPLYGHELGPGISPIQADLEWVVAWNKPSFRGRDALSAEKSRGPERKLFGISTEGRRPPRAGSDVYVLDHRIGVVTSGNFSPSLGHGIALALLEPNLDVGDSVDVLVRDARLSGQIVRRPFVDSSR